MLQSISGLAKNAALTEVKNKIPNINSLVKKTDYDVKSTEIEKKLTDHNHDKYTTTPEFSTLAAGLFNARLAQENLITKTDFNAKLSSLNRNITANKSKYLLVENELRKLKAFDLSYFIGKSYFEDVTQDYLVFGSGSYIYFWKCKELSDENITSTTSDYSPNPQLSYLRTKTRLEFRGSRLKQDKITVNHGKIVNIYNVYELDMIYV